LVDHAARRKALKAKTSVDVPSRTTSAQREGLIDDSDKGIPAPQKRICQAPMSLGHPAGFTQ
jgi:hypothetical protein